MNKLIALLILVSYWPIGLAVLPVAALRINLLCPRVHQFAWSAMYIGYAGYALGVVIYLSEHPPQPDALALPVLLMAGLASIAGNLYLTQIHWPGSPPRVTECQGVQP